METIVCATHPARRASLTCERCGSYACSDCAVDAPWGASMCVTCQARGGLRFPLAWESGSLCNPMRFARSAKAVLLDAPTVFAHLPEGGVVRPLVFTGWVALCLTLSSLVTDAMYLRVYVYGLQAVQAVGFRVLSELGMKLAWTYGLVLISALGFHASARWFGGQASFSVALRSAAYGSAFLLYNAVTTLASAVSPLIELGAIVISLLMQGYFYFTCLTITGVERYRLSNERAQAAAGATLGALLPSVFLGMLLLALGSVYAARFAALWNL
ncbi:MAG TPA: hypothetical protein VF331_20415 [Polyangiales bacterium]